MAKKWHTRVRDAVLRLGEIKNFESHGGKIYINKGDSLFEYNPDVIWLYRGKSNLEPNAIIWEIESAWPPPKSVAGDAILSCLVCPDYAEYFLRKNKTSFGQVLSEDVYVTTCSGNQRTYWADYHSELKPFAKGLVLVIEHDNDFSINYYRRYLKVIGYAGSMQFTDVIAVPKNLRTSEQILNRLSRLKQLDSLL